MILTALIATLAMLLIYRSAARYDAAHPHERWTDRDWEFAREHERAKNRARLSL